MQRVVARVVAAALGASAVASIVERAPLSHQSNRLFDVSFGGQHFIAKLYLQPARPNAAEQEYRALRLVEPLGIAPRPLFFDDRLGNVVIYEYLEGQMWDRRIPSAADLRLLAEVWVRLHALPTEGLWLDRGQTLTWPGSLARLRRGIDTYAAWADTSADSGHRAVAARCLRALDGCLVLVAPLESMPAPLRFCRSDPRFANVIARPDRTLGLVDWEDSGLRDPAREVADLLLHPNQEDLVAADAWSAFLNPYAAAARAAGDATFGMRLALYLRAFGLFWLSVLLEEGVQRARHGQLSRWRINDMPANARLGRYLARAEQGWPIVVADSPAPNFFTSPG